MDFAGYSFTGVLAAAVAGYGVGAVWYGVLGEHWLKALGLTRADIADDRGKPKSYRPFAVAFLADLVMAFVLAGLIGHLGEVTIRVGIISGAIVWAGFVITTLAVNNGFAMRSPALLWIDGGHWLLVLSVMGGVIGAIGA